MDRGPALGSLLVLVLALAPERFAWSLPIPWDLTLLGHTTHADTDVDHVEERRAANQASFPRAALCLVSRAARHDAM